MGILPYCVERRMKKRYEQRRNYYSSLEYTHWLKKILNAEILHYFDI